MTTQERPTFVVRSLVAIAYRFSQAPVSLTAPEAQSGVQRSLSDGRRIVSNPWQLRLAVERSRPAAAQGGVGDRRGQLRPSAAHLPVVGVPAAEPGTAVD